MVLYDTNVHNGIRRRLELDFLKIFAFRLPYNRSGKIQFRVNV